MSQRNRIEFGKGKRGISALDQQYEQLVRRGTLNTPKSNWEATVDPTVDDDMSFGYEVGSLWLNTTDNGLFYCTDATAGSAAWTELSAGGGAHTIASHSDTTATGPETETLTDGSDADALHAHTSHGVTHNAAHTLASHSTKPHSALTGIGTDDHHTKYTDAEAVAAAGVISRCFITAVTGAGSISNKAYEANTVPANKILTSFESDNDDITLTVEIHGDVLDGWTPANVIVSGAGITPVTVLKQNFSLVGSGHDRAWTASVNITDAATTGTLTATMSDGDTATVSYTRTLDPPNVLTAIWDNQGAQNPGDIYPDGTYVGQSAFKNNDNMQLSGTADSHATSVYIKDFEATAGQGLQGPYTVTAGAWTAANVKAGTGEDATARVKVYAVWGGADGPDFSSTATCNKDNRAPNIATPSIDYLVGAKQPTGPVGHRGLRAGGTCDVTAAITDHTASRILYTALDAVVLEPSDVYAATKTWTHNGTAGDWWDSVDGNNARIVAHNDANDLSTTTNFVIDVELDFDFDIPAGSGGGTLYQGSQVCVGDSDAFRLTGAHEAAITKIRVTRNGDYVGTGTSIASSYDDDRVVAGTTFDFESTARSDSVRDAAFNPKTCEVDIEVYKSGAWRTRHKVVDNSNGYGSIEVDTQTVPTFSAATVGYDPAGQTALKGVEDATVAITHTNPNGGETYVYTDNGSGDIGTISQTQGGGSDTTTYDVTKWCRLGNPGIYRVSGTNYKMTVTQPTYNGLAANKTALIQVADAAPTVKINGATARLGTDDGTNNYRDYTIQIESVAGATAAQQLNSGSIVAPANGGTFQGSWAANGNFKFDRTLRVADADIQPGGQTPNNKTWITISVKNIANFETTAITTNPTYQLGGFQQRTLSILGGTHTEPIGVPVVDTSKVTVVNTSKGGTPTQVYEGSVTEHEDPDPANNDFWTTVAADPSESFDDFTQYFHCSDKLFYDTILDPNTFAVTIVEAA